LTSKISSALQRSNSRKLIRPNPLQAKLKQEENACNCLAFAPDGETIALGSRELVRLAVDCPIPWLAPVTMATDFNI
jgi:hypothetical protein